MRLNVTATGYQVRTHEGAPAVQIKPLAQLRRAVMACLLWEDGFYESGQAIADRIKGLADQVSIDELASLAIEARDQAQLRHVPLILLERLSQRARGSGLPLVANTVERVIQRPDEMAELLAILWADGHKMVPKQMRRGLDRALRKFNEYSLAKYAGAGSKIKLRDVLRMVRPKPENDEQAALWQRVVKRELATPDTWEVALSGGADKRETFERLIAAGSLGYLALLRNLRNMAQAGVDPELVKAAIIARKNGAHRVFPFRYVAAARAAPQFEPALDAALCEAIAEMPSLGGITTILVDRSSSMDVPMSGKSDLTMIDAAATLASIVPGTVRMFAFSDRLTEVAPRRGMAGVDAIKATPSGGTRLGAAVEHLNMYVKHDRLIVVSDEQSHDPVPKPAARLAYMINPAANQHGVGYGNGWTHIDGFSEAVLRYIVAVEADSDR